MVLVQRRTEDQDIVEIRQNKLLQLVEEDVKSGGSVCQAERHDVAPHSYDPLEVRKAVVCRSER